MAIEAPTPTLPASAALQALAASLLVLSAVMLTSPAYSPVVRSPMRASSPSQAEVVDCDHATASAPAMPTFSAPAPATPSAASLLANSAEVFCDDPAATCTPAASATSVPSPIVAAVSLRAIANPTPTPMPTWALLSSLDTSRVLPRPRALKSLWLCAPIASSPPTSRRTAGSLSAPCARPTSARTSSSMTTAPTAAATASLLLLPVVWVPSWASWLSFRVELVLALSRSAAVVSSSALPPAALALATAS